MSGRRFALFAALALFVMFVAANLAANTWFRGARLDLTGNHLYTLSRGTARTLDELSEPVELKFYYSRDAGATNPAVQTYAARVREMLQTFESRAHGRVRFVEVNVERFSPEEDEAGAAGIEPRQLSEGGDPFYFGLVGANAIDDKRTIPFFDPAREPFLEYEVTRLIYELEHPDRARLALITSLALDPSMAGRTQEQSSLFASELGRLMQVEKLAPDFSEIPADIDLLAIIHPWALTDAQQYAIDQFILRRGRAFIALDPASFVAQQNAGAFDPFSQAPPAPPSSSLEQLLSRWGVAMTSEVVLDLDGALPVQAQGENGQPVNAPQPLFYRVPAEQRDTGDMLTAWLSRDINFGAAGGLSWSERPGISVTPLIKSSGRTMRIAATRALGQPSPFELLRDWPPAGGRIETLALRLSGNLETAFPQGPPEGAPPAAEGAQPLAASATPAEIVIVSDVDFLEDPFYVSPQTGPMADNGAFALNALDVLSGSDALVSLRSRAPSERRMELVDDMEREAQRRIETRQEGLQTELAETEQRLAELQARGQGSGFLAGDLSAELTPEEQDTLEGFRARVAEVRGELRTVGRDLRVEIDRLKTLIMFLNIWLAPLLVAGAGLVLFWRRQRRALKGSRR